LPEGSHIEAITTAPRCNGTLFWRGQFHFWRRPVHQSFRSPSLELIEHRFVLEIEFGE
jgi:hypothetical protein